jgi:glycogen(starch) synthase
MKILVINHEFPPVGGGAGNASKHIAAELALRGVDITFLTTAFKDLPRREVVDGYNLVRVPALRSTPLEAKPTEIISFSASALMSSLHRITGNPPDLVHAYFGIPGGAIAFALKALTDLPYLISFRGRDVHGGKALDSEGIGGLFKTISRPIWRAADALVANSDGLKSIAHRVEPSVDIDVIPNGIDTNRFQPGEGKREGDIIRILFVGRLEPYKGLDHLIEAIALIKPRLTGGLAVDIVGDGSLRDELPKQIRKFGVSQEFHLRGGVSPDHIPTEFQKADLFVLPSIVEGMPNVVLEAMASGLAVVATKIPGSQELVSHGQTGLLVPHSSPAALGEAILRLIENREDREQMGRNGRRAAESRSWGNVAEAYLNTFERVLKGQT